MTATSADAVPTTTSPLQVEELPIADLHPDPGNPRRIGEDELAALTRSIATFGVVDPVLARRADRRVIAGHQRLVAARRAGLTTVPVILLDLPVEDARLLNVALNQIGGEWDADLLARLLIDLRATAARDLTLSGFAEADLQDLLTRFDQREKRARPERFDLDEALATYRPRGQRDRPRRRLATGRPSPLPRRRHGRGVPGPVPGRPAGGHGLHGPALQRGPRCPRRPGARRARPASDQRRHARRRVGALLPGLGGELDGQRGRRPVRLHEQQGVAARLPRPGRGRGALVGHDHLGQGPLHAGPGRLSAPVRADLVRLAGGAPAALGRAGATRATSGRSRAPPPRRCTPPRSRWHWSSGRSRTPAPPGATVLDPFCGAGTTLIACERTGRCGVGIEIDPRYVAATIARWEAFTGAAAVPLEPREAADG